MQSIRSKRGLNVFLLWVHSWRWRMVKVRQLCFLSWILQSLPIVRTLNNLVIWRRHSICHPAPPLLLTACTNTFVPSLCETEGWHFANFITSSLSSWQLLQPGSKFPLATCHWHRRYLAFKPISASVCFFSTRRRSILSSLAGGLECHWVFLALNSINTIYCCKVVTVIKIYFKNNI